MNLLPYPRLLKRRPGFYTFPAQAALHLDPSLPRETVMLPMAGRLKSVAEGAGFQLELITGPSVHPRLAIHARQTATSPNHHEGYTLDVGPEGVAIQYRQHAGLRAAIATLRQLLREYGRRLPCLVIHDYPDFPRRGIMLDISRGRVPSLRTLLGLMDHLADFKINEFQLYTEHTFAYRNYESVWRDWGALTSEEILLLDARCQELGIDLVPNQNSFGHLRYWLEHPRLAKLAEITEPYEGADGTFLRYPTTLAPNNPGTLPFLNGLFDELLPQFTSGRFNVGCDETWDLGRGQSKVLCERKGKGRVYLDFVKKIHSEVRARKCQMMFWGDIILKYPDLISELPRDAIALNWGYEANHPFLREAGTFAKSKIPFYVCPGTSTWMTLIGRHDNALSNLRQGAEAGRKHGAEGYLNTDWGDGGHPQPLAVSYIPYLAGAALSWCGASFDQKLLVPVLSRDVFHDSTQQSVRAAMALGFAHRKFDYFAPNVTPYGTVIAAPLPKTRELMCRDGLKYYARIAERNIQAALAEVEQRRTQLRQAKPATRLGTMLNVELDLAARMAAQSCKIMLWQQALAAGKSSRAKNLAASGIRELRELDSDFRSYWPLRSKGTTEKCSPWLHWRIDDYRKGLLHFPPDVARGTPRPHDPE
ncbi:MAG: glycoside hydrolase [Verrucomicrobia bacterium]|nr:MAG: glycoside hydrolase [Verrucomicrobiota bacterium]